MISFQSRYTGSMSIVNDGVIDRHSVVCYIWINMVCRFSTAEPIIVPVDIITQVGCNATTKCSAESPYIIGWSTRRTSFVFQNTSTRFSWVSVTYEILMVVCVFVCPYLVGACVFVVKS